jgi:hypothetical protein
LRNNFRSRLSGLVKNVEARQLAHERFEQSCRDVGEAKLAQLRLDVYGVMTGGSQKYK